MEKLIFSHKTRHVYKMVSDNNNTILLDLDDTLVSSSMGDILSHSPSLLKPYNKMSFERNVFVANDIDQLIELTQNNELFKIKSKATKDLGEVIINGVEAHLILTAEKSYSGFNKEWSIEGYIPRIVLQYIIKQILFNIC